MPQIKSFTDLTEQEILALAISSEEDDARAYATFAHELMQNYPASAKVFADMSAEEFEHRDRLTKIFRAKFGDFIPLLRRSEVSGFMRRQPIYTLHNLESMRERAEDIEAENHRFYLEAANKAQDPSIKKLLHDLAEAEKEHGDLAQKLGLTHLTPDAKESEHHAHKRKFVLEIIQPGLVGLMDGSVSTLAPIFAAAFATGNTWSAFLVGLAASIGAGISMGLAEGLSDDGVLSGRGSPFKRGLSAGLMTTIGGLGHTLPFLIPHFHTAMIVAIVVVLIELAAITWIRWKYMETPWFKAALQIAVGGALVFLTGILIGSA